jgi:hypothetical protein
MAIPGSTVGREHLKFVESPTRPGETAVEVAGSVTATASQEKVLYEEASSTVSYLGKAAPGTATSAASWKISKITISGSLTSITYADSNSDYDNIWDNRGSLSYG